MEFHISRQTRDKLNFDDSLFSLDGNVVFVDLLAVRIFVNKINQQRDLIHYPEQAAKTGEVNALGLLDEIFHYVIYLYRQQKNPELFQKVFSALEQSIPAQRLDSVLQLFLKDFPPVAVYNKTQNSEEYLYGKTKGVPNRQLVLEEMILYWVTIHNPALEKYSELFDCPLLAENREFHQVFSSLDKLFANQPAFGPENFPLIDLLLSPSHYVPHSLTGQLEYVREHWGSFLGEYFYRILSSLDLLKEENKWAHAGPGPIPIPVYNLAALQAAGGNLTDLEAFSKDRAWMPGLVLIAKNAYVWLNQLSQKYQHSFTHLDQIPEIELQFLAQSGVTGLWLIGLWERSLASATIKKLCGNPEAIASAYSLYSYEIAGDLGGVKAYEELRDKAGRFGIRLASDMVPNHMGIDSEWVIHHPDRFLSLDQCPYPSYTFNGPDLSNDPRVTIQIEDHYYERTDAAVVFRRIDHQSGQTKFIYHGNDGTSMPWNDTAQLNYLNAEVREAVYQTILEVARKFPIIRFDAAMTLAKKQVQRLWFPEPGSGGAIPSRSEHALTKEQFDAAMPTEFWRDVVDRIAVEAPDTLLLAEAFWMMEGYFVRTLGIHRVYNSAFMHMLRDENNAGYRQLLKNTLEFEPEILKRYVNFMNNPDERTAVDQFGKGDKYFGICTLMATFPGLPMFGHGQFEGFAEKYGMEYHHAYLHEEMDTTLVERHQREIFPLLHKRELYSGVENFYLFDFSTPDGTVNENVFAFTNRRNEELTLVVYNNNYQSTGGWIKFSVPKLVNNSGEKFTSTCSLSESIGLTQTNHRYIIFRDQSTGMQFIRRVKQIVNDGFHIHLNGYETHVFLDFQLVSSDSHHDYGRLCDYLGEQGVPDIEKGLHELIVQPVLRPFREIVNPGYFKYLTDLSLSGKEIPASVILEAETKLKNLIAGIEVSIGKLPDKTPVSIEILKTLKSVLSIPSMPEQYAAVGMKKTLQAAGYLTKNFKELDSSLLICWAFIGFIGHAKNADSDYLLSQTWAEEWQFYKTFINTLKQMDIPEDTANRCLHILRLITSQQDWYSRLSKASLIDIVKTWFSTPETQGFIQVNRFEDILWYNRESFSTFLYWMFVVAVIKSQTQPGATQNETIETILGCYDIICQLQKADEKSEYQLDKLFETLEKNRI